MGEAAGGGLATYCTLCPGLPCIRHGLNVVHWFELLHTYTCMHVYTLMYMEIHVHSILAKKVHIQKKGNGNPTQYKTQGQNIRI